MNEQMKIAAETLYVELSKMVGEFVLTTQKTNDFETVGNCLLSTHSALLVNAFINTVKTIGAPVNAITLHETFKCFRKYVERDIERSLNASLKPQSAVISTEDGFKFVEVFLDESRGH